MIFPIKRGRFRIVCVSVWSQTHCCLSFRVSGPTWTSFVWAGCQTRRATVPGLGSETLGPGLGCYRFYRSLVCHLCWLWMGRIIRQAGGGVIFFTVHLKHRGCGNIRASFSARLNDEEQFVWPVPSRILVKGDIKRNQLDWGFSQKSFGVQSIHNEWVSVVIEDPQISYGPSCWPRCCGNKLFLGEAVPGFPLHAFQGAPVRVGCNPEKGSHLLSIHDWFWFMCDFSKSVVEI